MEVACALVSEIVGGGTGDRHREQEEIERPFGNLGCRPEYRWLTRRRSRHTLDVPKQKANSGENKDRDAGIGVKTSHAVSQCRRAVEGKTRAMGS